MGESRVKKLYRQMGPVLYARAQRALKDPRLAEQLTKEVTIELAGLKNLDDAELLKRGRARLAELAKEYGGRGVMDSMQPGGRSGK